MSETTAPVIATTHNKRSAWKPVAAAGIGGAVLIATGFGVFAQLNATATNTTAQAVNSGDLRLLLAADSTAGGALSTGFTQGINNLAPGDAVNRLVSVTNAGSLDGKPMTFKVVPNSTTLLSDATRGLQITVANCSTAWTATLSTPPATAFAGTPTSATAPSCSAPVGSPVTTSLSVLMSATLTTLSNAVTTAGSVNHFLVTVALPDQAETSVNGLPASPAAGLTGSIQRLSTALTYTFSEDQRTGIASNS